jgi:hypothetical protein
MNSELQPNDLLNLLETMLKPTIAADGGKVNVANDAFNVIEILGEAAPSYRVVLLWEGDEDATGQPLAGIVNNTIAVIVSHNRGLRLWRGESVYKDTAARKSLLTIVSNTRARLRSCDFPPDVTTQRLLYLGCTAEITPDGLPLDAYRLRFRLTTTLPARSF